MIIYNVTIKIDDSIHNEWIKWMQEEHIPDLMQTGLFTESKLCRLLEQDDSEGPTYAAQYFCKSLEEYNEYITKYAPSMREKGFVRFGNKFIAFRTVMEIIS